MTVMPPWPMRANIRFAMKAATNPRAGPIRIPVTTDRLMWYPGRIISVGRLIPTSIAAVSAPSRGIFFFMSMVRSRSRLKLMMRDMKRNPRPQSQTGKTPSGMCICVITRCSRRSSRSPPNTAVSALWHPLDKDKGPVAVDEQVKDPTGQADHQCADERRAEGLYSEAGHQVRDQFQQGGIDHQRKQPERQKVDR